MRDPEYPMQLPDFSPFQPQRLSFNEAKARTTIAQRAANMPLHLGGSEWLVDLSPQINPDDPSPDDWVLALEWAGAPFCLRLSKAMADQLAAPLLPDALLPTLPTELAMAVLEASLSEAVVTLSSWGRGAPQLLDMQPAATEVPTLKHAYSLRLRPTDGSAPISTTLFSDSLGLLLLAGMVSKRAVSRPQLDAELVLKLPAEIGATRLAEDILTTLTTGDVVLMDTCHLGADRVLWLSADGSSGIHVHVPSQHLSSEYEHEDAVPPTLTVIQAWNSAMPAENAPAHPVASIDAVPVRLSFDLGEVTLTVAEARSLQPGQPIALSRPLSGPVNIRANGALVGYGDLVEIDGQLGVSIRSLFAANGPNTL